MVTDLRGLHLTGGAGGTPGVPGVPGVVGTPGVDPAVLRLLAGCTADLVAQEAELVLSLHQRLLELTPVIARAAGSGRPMCQRLVAAALHAGDPTGPPAHLAAVVQQVGADNDLEGFPGDQYSAVTHALLHAVREVFRGEWSSVLSSAWVEYLLWFRGHLLTGVEAARAYDAAQATPVGAGPTRPDTLPPLPPPAPTYDPFADRFVPSVPAAAPVAVPPVAAYPGPPGPDAELSLPVGARLDDDLDDADDDDAPAFGGLMGSMTLNSRRDRRRR